MGKPASLEEIRPWEWDFLRRLREYPELKAKIETLLAIIEQAGGDVAKAAEAERRSIEEMRKMGNEVMHRWARHQQQKKEAEYQVKPGMNGKEKTTSMGTGDWEKSKERSKSSLRVAADPRFAPFPHRQKSRVASVPPVYNGRGWILVGIIGWPELAPNCTSIMGLRFRGARCG